MHLKLDYFLTYNISDNIFRLLHQTWHDDRLMDAIYAHDHFNDLDLEARSQWVSKGKNQCCMFSASKQAISIKLATTVGHFYVTLTLQTYLWLGHLLGFFLWVTLAVGKHERYHILTWEYASQ